MNGSDVIRTNPVGHYILGLGGAALVLLGTVGNILSIVVLKRTAPRGCKMSSTILMLCCLSIMDTITLDHGLLRLVVHYTAFVASRGKFGFDIRRHLGASVSAVTCPISAFLATFSLHAGSWLIVILTLERFCCVTFPMKASTIATRRNAILGMLSVVVAMILIDGHILFGVRYMKRPPLLGHHCQTVSDSYKYFFINVFVWMDVIFGSVLPFALITTMNAAIIRQLISASSQRQTISTSETSSKAENNTTKTLLAISIVFIVTTMPDKALRVYSERISAVFLGGFVEILGPTLRLLEYTNSAVNFVLYMLCGSRFRREFARMFKQK
ncbi:FMRFamide receptor-like [Tubulanus polymorphus]|uniref:FMRFamide receptor-like n=1 Tax=Tubulanus polymorphus TaxID=672921 RepID=UPI003DA587E0